MYFGQRYFWKFKLKLQKTFSRINIFVRCGRHLAVWDPCGEFSDNFIGSRIFVELDYISSLIPKNASLGKICAPRCLGPKLTKSAIVSIFTPVFRLCLSNYSSSRQNGEDISKSLRIPLDFVAKFDEEKGYIIDFVEKASLR